ncbi:MAG: hypothetical protein ACPGOV_07625 [Magnetovibrionaceae bacterium]
MSVAVAPVPRFEGAQSPASVLARAAQPVACFSVVCAADDPGLLPRILEPFAKLSLVPLAIHATRWSDTELHVDLQFAGLDAVRISHLAEVIRAMFGVEAVLTSEKHLA